jgi:hypothetical protein
VQCSLPLGDLGILYLKFFGSALRVQWLWLQYTELDRVRALLLVKEDPITTAFFLASTTFDLGDGHLIKF